MGLTRRRLLTGALVSPVAAALGCVPHDVVADTFLRFEGLERPAVIVTDLRLVADMQDKRLHIALTRALATARVVAPRDVLRAVAPFAPEIG
jgi:hypothetical protein